MKRKYFCSALFFFFLFIQSVLAQRDVYVEIKLKNVSDTVLGRRWLLLPEPFPYKEGVATRLLGMSDFSDTGGRQYKVLFFNHSQHDVDGILMSRFTGGLRRRHLLNEIRHLLNTPIERRDMG